MCTGSGCTPLTTNYVYDNANRLTSVNGVAYTWDNNGNLLSDGVSTYTYDAANRLKTVTQGSTVSSYVYNGLGDRLSQTVNGVTTQYTLDLNPSTSLRAGAGLTQVLADGTSTYLYGDTRLAQSTASGMQYFAGDALGSVRQLTNSAGVVALTRSYEPYGTVLNSSGSTSTAYGFTGEWTDSTGLVHLRARYYASSQGRFLTADAWPGDELQPQTLNGWGYVEGNPINRVDPSGWCSQSSNPGTEPCPPDDLLTRILQWIFFGGSVTTTSSPGLCQPEITLPKQSTATRQAAPTQTLTSTPRPPTMEPLYSETPNPATQMQQAKQTKTPTSTTTSTIMSTAQKCSEIEKGIRSLQKQLDEHEQKLRDYIADPDAHDNLGLLKGAPEWLRKKIIEARIAVLERQITMFHREIEKLEERLKDCKD